MSPVSTCGKAGDYSRITLFFVLVGGAKWRCPGNFARGGVDPGKRWWR